MNKSSLSIFVLLMVLLACSPKTTVIDTNLDSSKINLPQANFKYLNTKTRIKYKDSEFDVSTTATIRIKKDSVIWMSITPVLGIEAARAMITQDSMVLLNRLQKEYMVYNFKNLSEKYSFDINYSLIQSMILGGMPIENNGADHVVGNREHFIVKQQNGPYSIDNFIHRKRMQLERVQMSEKLNRNSLLLEYDNFKSIQTFSLPLSSSVSLNYIEDNQLRMTEIDIKHGRAEISDASLPFPFSIPARYERVQ